MTIPVKEVNPAIVEQRQELARRYRANRPFRHVVLDDFLDPVFCRRLLAEFPAFDERRAFNENDQIGGKATQQEVAALGPAYRSLDVLVRGPAFRGLVSTITGIERLQYDPEYVGGGTHENRHGQELDPHVDFNFHPRSNQHRRLNLILYLNDEWRPEWGGCLDLHLDPYRPPGEDTIERIVPEFNRCVIFETTERSWHGFEPIKLPPDRRDRTRKSLALYYYTNERPAAETAAPHSTIYVERHLPTEIEAGEPLSAEDLERIRTLIARRDHHLKRLYRDLAQLRKQLNYVYASRSWKLTRPLRGLSQLLTRSKNRP